MSRILSSYDSTIENLQIELEKYFVYLINLKTYNVSTVKKWKSPRSKSHLINQLIIDVYFNEIIPKWFVNGSVLSQCNQIYRQCLLPSIDIINRKQGNLQNKIILDCNTDFTLCGTNKDSILYNTYFNETQYYGINVGFPKIERKMKEYFANNNNIDNLIIVQITPYVYQYNNRYNLPNSPNKLKLHADSLISIWVDQDKALFSMITRNSSYWNNKKNVCCGDKMFNTFCAEQGVPNYVIELTGKGSGLSLPYFNHAIQPINYKGKYEEILAGTCAPSTTYFDWLNSCHWIFEDYEFIIKYCHKLRELSHLKGQPHVLAKPMRECINKLRESMTNSFIKNISEQSPQEIKISINDSKVFPIYQIDMKGKPIHSNTFSIQTRRRSPRKITTEMGCLPNHFAIKKYQFKKTSNFSTNCLNKNKKLTSLFKIKYL